MLIIIIIIIIIIRKVSSFCLNWIKSVDAFGPAATKEWKMKPVSGKFPAYTSNRGMQKSPAAEGYLEKMVNCRYGHAWA